LLTAWQLLRETTSAFRPPPRLTVSEWADQFRRLSPESSAEPGRWRTSRAEYQRGIMDAVNDPAVEAIVMMSSAQVGKSEFGLNICGYFISQDPCPVLVLNPTLEMSETWSKDRLSPMLRDTPVLQNRVKDPRARDSGNTLLHKKFPGGHITMAGANSPASLASRPIRIVIGDEIDRYPPSAGSEGDPVNLAKKRTTTFWNRKLIWVSTPTIKGASRIENLYQQSDQRRYFVPCPHCKKFQILTWGQVKFDKEIPKQAWYECEHCQQQIESKHKTQMIRLGEWRATAEFKDTAGFHLNELYSPWRTFGDVVVDFLKAKDSPEQLKTWVNTSLGETFDDQGGEGLEWQRLMARAEPYSPLTVPKSGLLLTAGVDVQGDRLSVSVWAWGRGEESWLIYSVELYGEPTLEPVWAELDTLLESKFTHQGGAELSITAAGIDSGYQSQVVYNFVRRRPGRGLYAVKGFGTAGRPVMGRPTTQEVTWRGQTLKKGVKLWPVGVDAIKSLIYGRLRMITPGPGYLHFPIGLDEEFYQQLCAEKQIARYSKGFAIREWVKMRSRNEALDTLVYAYAVATAIGLVRLDWVKLEASIAPQVSIDAQAETLAKPLPENPNPGNHKSGQKRLNRQGKGNFATSW
jgi:phage terminase large subunit GpA-like protein